MEDNTRITISLLEDKLVNLYEALKQAKKFGIPLAETHCSDEP